MNGLLGGMFSWLQASWESSGAGKKRPGDQLTPLSPTFSLRRRTEGVCAHKSHGTAPEPFQMFPWSGLSGFGSSDTLLRAAVAEHMHTATRVALAGVTQAEWLWNSAGPRLSFGGHCSGL